MRTVAVGGEEPAGGARHAALNLGSTALEGSAGLTAADALPLPATARGIAAIAIVATMCAIRAIKLRWEPAGS